MGKLIAILGAAIAGLLVAGALGFLAGQAPVFHWEMAGLILAVLSAVGGAVAGAAGAASGKLSIGACAGALGGGSLFALAYLSQDGPTPPALLFWGTVTAALAAAISGLLGGALATSRR
jgi:hypothetical protein